MVIRHIFIILVAALLVRIGNLLLLDTTEASLLVEDGILYWDSSTALMTQKFGNLAELTRLVANSERAPGYIIFLAGIRYLFGDSFYTVLIVQSVIDSLTCVLIASIGAALPSVLAPRLALLTGLIAAVTPNFIIHGAMFLSDTLFLFFSLQCCRRARDFYEAVEHNGSPSLVWR